MFLTKIKNLTFRRSNCDEVLTFDQVLEKASSEYIDCKINTGKEYIIDKSYRVGKQTWGHSFQVNFSKEYIDEIHNIEGCKNWKLMPIRFDLLCYEKSGFFKKHNDYYTGTFEFNNKKFNHVATMVIYPPKILNEHEGGELLVYLKDKVEIVKSSDNGEWTILIMKLGIEHEVLEMLSGIRYVLKGPVFERID